MLQPVIEQRSILKNRNFSLWVSKDGGLVELDLNLLTERYLLSAWLGLESVSVGYCVLAIYKVHDYVLMLLGFAKKAVTYTSGIYIVAPSNKLSRLGSRYGEHFAKVFFHLSGKYSST